VDSVQTMMRQKNSQQNKLALSTSSRCSMCNPATHYTRKESFL